MAVTWADDVADLIASDLDEVGTDGSAVVSGTYTPISGTTLTDQDALQRNFSHDPGSGYCLMEVLIPKSALSSAQVGASWSNGDGRPWRVTSFDDSVPVFMVLQVECHTGTGANT